MDFDWSSPSEEAELLVSADASPLVDVEEVGTSVEGAPIHAVHLGGHSRDDPAALMLIGTQHGDEPAGREAILRFISAIADDPEPNLVSFLEDHPIVAIPTVNPDGLANGQRTNANDADINRDHAAMTEPETRALHSVLASARPNVVLDMHESYNNIDPSHLIEFSRGYHPEIRSSVDAIAADLLSSLLARAESEQYPTGEYESATADDPRSFRNAGSLDGHVVVITETNANYDLATDRALRLAAQSASLDATIDLIISQVGTG